MKKNSLFNLILILIFIISLLTYEVHIHSLFYSYFQLILMILTIINFLIILKDKTYNQLFSFNLKKNISLIILSLFMIISSCFSVLKYNENSITSLIFIFAYIINIFFYFIVVPLYLKTNTDFENKLFKILVLFIIPLSIFGIILHFRNGLFGYLLEGGRSGSIYFDPNFFSVVALIGAFVAFKCDYSKKTKVLFFIISLFSIVVSGSRGTMLSLFICIIYYITIKFPKKNILKKYSIILLLTVCLLVVYNYLNKIGFLRLYQGSNGRTELLVYSFKKIKESWLFGFGYDSVARVLSSGGFKVVSSHNSLVDIMLRYGVPTFIVQLLIIMKSTFKSVAKNTDLIISLLIIILLVNMNTILYSFGGIGFPSMMLTICLGYSVVDIRRKNEK